MSALSAVLTGHTSFADAARVTVLAGEAPAVEAPGLPVPAFFGGKPLPEEDAERRLHYEAMARHDLETGKVDNHVKPPSADRSQAVWERFDRALDAALPFYEPLLRSSEEPDWGGKTGTVQSALLLPSLDSSLRQIVAEMMLHSQAKRKADTGEVKLLHDMGPISPSSGQVHRADAASRWQAIVDATTLDTPRAASSSPRRAGFLAFDELVEGASTATEPSNVGLESSKPPSRPSAAAMERHRHLRASIVHGKEPAAPRPMKQPESPPPSFFRSAPPPPAAAFEREAFAVAPVPPVVSDSGVVRRAPPPPPPPPREASSDAHCGPQDPLIEREFKDDDLAELEAESEEEAQHHATTMISMDLEFEASDLATNGVGSLYEAMEEQLGVCPVSIVFQGRQLAMDDPRTLAEIGFTAAVVIHCEIRAEDADALDDDLVLEVDEEFQE
jgi:hypothetical protein